MISRFTAWSGIIRLAGFALVSTTVQNGLSAEDPDTGPYLRGGIGVSVVTDSTVRDFLGVVNEGELRFDAGMAVPVGAGYSFNRWLAVEFETGFLLNTVDQIGEESISGDAALYQTPVLANVIFQYRNSTDLVPYVGGGVGGSFQVFTADDLRVSGTYLDGSDTDFVFAWQLFGGLKYEFNEYMGVGVTYRYRDTEASSWHVSDSPSDLRVNFAPIKTHSVVAEFHYRF